ncbi:MAG: glutamate mutase [Firmicutes bacterium]|nr:glutamate mutase [Bacillota bacterium]
MEKFRWSDEKFAQERVKVSVDFPQGEEINLIESTEYLHDMPIHRSCSYKLKAARDKGLTLLQSGMSGDIMSAAPGGKTTSELRRLFDELDMPVQGKITGPDLKVQCELLCASGWTSIAGGGISYNVPYEGDFTLEQSLKDWQYCDRLVSFYDECGIPINRETSVPPSEILVPPSISNAVSIIEMLMAAGQGVKDITLAQRQYGNMNQDVAAMMALREQAEEYRLFFGFKDLVFTASMHQLKSEFKEDESLDGAGAAYGSMTAAMAGADKVVLEWSGASEAKNLLNMLYGQRLPLSKELETEIAIIKAETKCIISRVLEAAPGDLASGIIKSFETGVLDLPSAPAGYCLGELTTGRDRLGAVRYLNAGRIPLSDELKRFNKRKLQERDEIERGKDS